MPWERIVHQRPNKEDLRTLLEEVQFYLDQDVDAVVAEMLRWLKYDVETARDVHGEAQSDQWHFKRAFAMKRVLVSRDKDFLDNEKFPLAQTSGVIILNIDHANAGEIARALEVIHFVLSKLRRTLQNTKVVLNGDYTLTLISRRGGDNGFSTHRTRYRVDAEGTEVWVPDDGS